MSESSLVTSQRNTVSVVMRIENLKHPVAAEMIEGKPRWGKNNEKKCWVDHELMVAGCGPNRFF